MSERFNIGREDFSSIVRLIESQLDLSVDRQLAETQLSEPDAEADPHAAKKR